MEGRIQPDPGRGGRDHPPGQRWPGQRVHGPEPRLRRGAEAAGHREADPAGGPEGSLRGAAGEGRHQRHGGDHGRHGRHGRAGPAGGGHQGLRPGGGALLADADGAGGAAVRRGEGLRGLRRVHRPGERKREQGPVRLCGDPPDGADKGRRGEHFAELCFRRMEPARPEAGAGDHPGRGAGQHELGDREVGLRRLAGTREHHQGQGGLGH